MKRIAISMLVAFVLVLFAVTPDTLKAEDNLAEDSVVEDKGTLVDVIDYGDGTVIYFYIKEEPSVVNQPYAATSRTVSKYGDVYVAGTYSFTVKQTATFVYDRPDALVVVNSASGVISSQSSSSAYKPGTPSTSYSNGSPAVVTTTIKAYRKSDSALYGTYNVNLHLYNSGNYA